MIDLGLAIDRLGCQLNYDDCYIIKTSTHKTILPLEAIAPVIQNDNRISFLATLAGSIALENNVTIGCGAVLKADKSQIRIGLNTVVGDYCTLITRQFNGQISGSINIGMDVFVGDKVILKCCTIDDQCWIGHNSIIEEGVIVERSVIVKPGSFVPAGYILRNNSVYEGSPVKRVRTLTKEDANEMVKYSQLTRQYYDNLNQKQSFLDLSKA